MCTHDFIYNIYVKTHCRSNALRYKNNMLGILKTYYGNFTEKCLEHEV